jgi:hypothetical protein
LLSDPVNTANFGVVRIIQQSGVPIKEKQNKLQYLNKSRPSFARAVIVFIQLSPLF